MYNEYDIFISYRRDGGFETARIIYDRLRGEGYSVFFDVETLRSGRFNTALYDKIEQCTDFIAVLSPGSLDRCQKEDDWLRFEIAHAIKNDKNVIPIMTRGFEMPPPNSLPPDIAELTIYSGLKASPEFFDAFLARLLAFLKSGLSCRPHSLLPQRPEEAQWHYVEGDREEGPVTLAELAPRITPETEVWRSGMESWVAAGQVPELKEKLRPPRQKPPIVVQPPKRTQEPAAGETRVFADIEMVWCPPGEFLMGSPRSEKQRERGEGPQHCVTFAQGFWLGKYAVTQAEWKAAMGNNPSHFTGDARLPVESLLWIDCLEFIERLNLRSEGLFRLPSEAEWEYACRAGTITPFYYGDTLSPEQANYNGILGYGNGNIDIYREKTTPVGSFPPNAWGLYDMHGNVWEWCQDWYHDSYEDAPTDGSAWDSEQPSSFGDLRLLYRVLRGGSWDSSAGDCRSAYRHDDVPRLEFDIAGFRLARHPQ